MNGYSELTIWLIIVTAGLGTYGLRWSFLGAFGNRPMPGWAQKLLRYTAVAVLPAIAAPLVAWPAATGGQPDPHARLVPDGAGRASDRISRRRSASGPW